MKNISKWILIVMSVVAPGPVLAASDSVSWKVDNLTTIGGSNVTIYGNPKVIETPAGKAVEFDGVDDGLLVDANPLAGAEAFTLEIEFMPYSGGTFEQRFCHIQQDDNNRVLTELRSTTNDQWYLDTFIKSGSSSLALINKTNLNTNNKWHHIALTYQKGAMLHYVDGKLELTGSVTYALQTSGKTSLGVRQNKVSWFKGAIRSVKVTPRVLTPSEFQISRDIAPSKPEG